MQVAVTESLFSGQSSINLDFQNENSVPGASGGLSL